MLASSRPSYSSLPLQREVVSLVRHGGLSKQCIDALSKMGLVAAVKTDMQKLGDGIHLQETDSLVLPSPFLFPDLFLSTLFIFFSFFKLRAASNRRAGERGGGGGTDRNRGRGRGGASHVLHVQKRERARERAGHAVAAVRCVREMVPRA